MVAGVPVGRLWSAGLDGFASTDAGKLLHGDFTVAVHHAYERLLRFVLKDDRFQHGVVIHDKLRGGLDRAAMRGERVFFHRKNRLRRLEGANGHCHRDFFFHFGVEVYQIRDSFFNSNLRKKKRLTAEVLFDTVVGTG
jgi:hypothetical protein